mmetsp:Transcript_10568/g.36757  ORF Transcript_10568/g.36757 Transcript_10568/m.36757 type:complete len:241 (-) Transcript_10568:3180-3902(-)
MGPSMALACVCASAVMKLHIAFRLASVMRVSSPMLAAAWCHPIFRFTPCTASFGGAFTIFHPCFALCHSLLALFFFALSWCFFMARIHVLSMSLVERAKRHSGSRNMGIAMRIPARMMPASRNRLLRTSIVSATLSLSFEVLSAMRPIHSRPNSTSTDRMSIVLFSRATKGGFFISIMRCSPVATISQRSWRIAELSASAGCTAKATSERIVSSVSRSLKAWLMRWWYLAAAGLCLTSLV